MSETIKSKRTSSSTLLSGGIKKKSTLAPKRASTSLSSNTGKTLLKSENNTNGLARPTKPKLILENKENEITLVNRITKLEEKFEDLKKTIERLVHLENIVKELSPTIQTLQDEIQILKETSNSQSIITNIGGTSSPEVEPLTSEESSLIYEPMLITAPKTIEEFKELDPVTQPKVEVKDFPDTCFDEKPESGNNASLTLQTPMKSNDESLVSRTPKLGDFGISATTLANLPKSNRHKSLSSITSTLTQYRTEVNETSNYSSCSLSPKPLQESGKLIAPHLDPQPNESESIQNNLYNISNISNISRKRRKEKSSQQNQDCVDSMFPLMKLVVEEELSPIKFLLGAVDLNRLNNVIEKINDHIADQGFDYGIYIKTIKHEDIIRLCKIPEKMAKLISHILCKLMRLEMKTENEYKILSGSTIRS